MIAVAIVGLLSLAAVAGFAAFAVRAQRHALDRVLQLWAEQSEREAEERHVLANRIQRPEVLQVARRVPEQSVEKDEPSGAHELAGTDQSHREIADLAKAFVTGDEEMFGD